MTVRPVIPVLAVIIVLRIELGLDVVESVGVEEPLLLRPESPGSSLPEQCKVLSLDTQTGKYMKKEGRLILRRELILVDK